MTALDPASEPASGPQADGASAGAAGAARRRRPPVVRWILALPPALYAALVLGIVVVLLLVAVLLNPGERVGPVQPARPPVGGPGVPAARL